ncbi:MAG: tRNA lysidine(34) synthetase TilS, partial [Planctomycetia bacterium]|nr:tRNA lysidine(34) synthetase TilS [Planctomycetia bacterium]
PAAIAAAIPAHGFWSSPVVIGVSGGADSVALLLILARLAAVAGGRLVVAHARHDLRAAAVDDEAFVTALCGRLGLQLATMKLAVLVDVERRGEGVEGRARRLRYEFLVDVARRHAARHVAVAHTADDQAETILHRCLRGTGLAGLAGMPPARELGDGIALVRPLLSVPRRAVRDYLAGVGQPWCEDESNADVRYARNFIRHEILARVEDGPYPAAVAAIERLGRQASRVAAAIASAADHLIETCSSRQEGGTVVIRTAALSSLDRHLVAEMIVALWRRERWPRRDMTARHYAAVAGMVLADGANGVGSRRPAAADMPGGIRVRLDTNGLLTLVPPAVGVSGARPGPCSPPAC